MLSRKRTFEVVDLERDVGDGLDEVGVWSVGVIALPLDPELTGPVVADGHLEVRQRDLPVKPARVGIPMWLNLSMAPVS